MKISLSDQSLRQKLPRPGVDALRRNDVRSLAGVAGELHGYAIAQSLLFRQMRLGEMKVTGLAAVRKLQRLRLVTAVEAAILADCLSLPTESTDVVDYRAAIVTARGQITGTKMSSPVAVMLIGIAADAARREVAAQPKKSKTKKQTGAQKKQNKKTIFALVGDVVGATVGAAAAGGAGIVTGPGAVVAAFVVGSMAATAVSGAILV